MAKNHTFTVFIALFVLALSTISTAQAACGGAYQRMQVGVLPDLFLNHTDEHQLELGQPLSWGRFDTPTPIPLPPVRQPLQMSVFVSEKTIPYHWTANEALPGVGDCNVWAFFTMDGLGAANTYSACSEAPHTCLVVMSPEATVVGPSISDNVVKQWSLRVVADSELEPERRTAVMLIGLDCQGDICEEPPCLMQRPESEFYEGPDRSCFNFDPGGEGWRSRGDGYGQPYLIGRGNVYIGPYQQPAFALEASSDTDFLKIDHWIVNGRPDAVIMVTPTGRHSGSTKFFGVKFREMDRTWGIVAESEGAVIPAGSRFNVYVMSDQGGDGPGFVAWDLTGQSEFWLDDPLLNSNPNGVVFVTHVVARACVLVDENPPGILKDVLGDVLGDVRIPGMDEPDEETECVSGHFPHPVGVRYDEGRGQWAIVSLDGASFPPQVAFNVFASGLAGTYRQSLWEPGKPPEYARRLEVVAAAPDGSTTALANFDSRNREALVFVTPNLTPYTRSAPLSANLYPVGVDYVDGKWRVVNLDGSAMAATAFNVVTPLRAP